MPSKAGEANLGFVLADDFSDKEQPALPIAVFLQPDAEKMMVSSVYMADGVLCIDVESVDE